MADESQQSSTDPSNLAAELKSVVDSLNLDTLSSSSPSVPSQPNPSIETSTVPSVPPVQIPVEQALPQASSGVVIKNDDTLLGTASVPQPASPTLPTVTSELIEPALRGTVGEAQATLPSLPVESEITIPAPSSPTVSLPTEPVSSGVPSPQTVTQAPLAAPELPTIPSLSTSEPEIPDLMAQSQQPITPTEQPATPDIMAQRPPEPAPEPSAELGGSAQEEDGIDIFSILSQAVKLEASDIYIKSDSPATAKVLGRLVPLTNYKLSDFGVEKLAKSMMNEKQNIKFSENMSLDMSFSPEGIGRFRVNIFRQRGTVAMVLRRIKTNVPTFEDLHSPEVLRTVALQKRGLVLVTGATGSGKTSTLSAMLDYRNANTDGHIITLEDPIEFMLTDKKSIVSQREIDIDTLSWEKALVDAMREAPDVVLIGELRDLFAAKTALNLAETGHFVLSTLHSTDALQTMERLIALFPSEQHQELYIRLSMSLVAIVCQRLVVTKDKKSRYPVQEIMLSSPRIRDLIRKGEFNAIKEVIGMSKNDGMQIFDQHLLELWKAGIITDEEALHNSDSPNNLKLLMKGISYAEAQ